MWKNLLITFCSIAAAVLGAEILVRNYMAPVSIFGPWYIQSQNVKGYEWSFLYSNKPEQNTLSNFHPVYGWDHSSTGIRISGSIEAPRQNDLKILFVGDSFIYGSEVEAHQTIAAQLHNYLPNIYSINMGVPGFGIDQAYLKLIERGLHENPDVVVFGVHPPNYERSTIDFFHLPKPVFDLADNGKLRLNLPNSLPSSKALYDQISSQRKNDMFTINGLIKAFYVAKSKFTDTDIDNFLKKHNRIVENIFRAAKTKAIEAGALFLVIQIPHGNRFRSPESHQSLAKSYPLNKNLLEIYKRTEIDYIDLETEFMRDFEIREIFESLYTHPQDSNNAGHLSPLGSSIASQLIAEKLQEMQMNAAF